MKPGYLVKRRTDRMVPTTKGAITMNNGVQKRNRLDKSS